MQKSYTDHELKEFSAKLKKATRELDDYLVSINYIPFKYHDLKDGMLLYEFDNKPFTTDWKLIRGGNPIMMLTSFDEKEKYLLNVSGSVEEIKEQLITIYEKEMLGISKEEDEPCR